VEDKSPAFYPVLYHSEIYFCLVPEELQRAWASGAHSDSQLKIHLYLVSFFPNSFCLLHHWGFQGSHPNNFSSTSTCLSFCFWGNPNEDKLCPSQNILQSQLLCLLHIIFQLLWYKLDWSMFT
jgi:hypothetical protein